MTTQSDPVSGYCLECHYDMTGLESPEQCPECGGDLAAQGPLREARRGRLARAPRIRRSVWLLAVAAPLVNSAGAVLLSQGDFRFAVGGAALLLFALLSVASGASLQFVIERRDHAIAGDLWYRSVGYLAGPWLIAPVYMLAAVGAGLYERSTSGINDDVFRFMWIGFLAWSVFSLVCLWAAMKSYFDDARDLRVHLKPRAILWVVALMLVVFGGSCVFGAVGGAVAAEGGAAIAEPEKGFG